MNWHAATVPAERLVPLLDSIRCAGGIIAAFRPDVDGVHVTWTDGSFVNVAITDRPAADQ